VLVLLLPLLVSLLLPLPRLLPLLHVLLQPPPGRPVAREHAS
jgi:hypothetical protein